MPTHALHRTELPSFAQSWPQDVLAVVEAQLDQEIPVDDLRTIVLAPTQDRLKLGVWLGVEWEDYPYAEDPSNAAGFVSLGSWLDGVDAIALGEKTLPAPRGWLPRRPLSFTDSTRDTSFEAWWLALHDAVVATAIQLATKHLAQRFKQPVGVFVSLTGTEARLVAFCHPRGAPLWPVQEHRTEHGYGSAYPAASLAGDQLTIFYPKGEGDGSGPPGIRSWTQADVEYARSEDDDREVYVRFAGQREDVRFSGGHTQEEMGGPDQREVTDALRQHFAARGQLKPKADEAPPIPADAAALNAALSALTGEREQQGLAARLAKAYGVARVEPLLEGLPVSEKLLGLLHKSLASQALDDGDWPRAFAHIDRVTGKDRTRWMVTRALVGLGRWDAVLANAEDDDHAERALALHGLGRDDEALKALGDEDGAGALAVRALLHAKSDPAKAAALLSAALAAGPRAHLMAHVGAEPSFHAAIDARRAQRELNEQSRAAIASVPATPFEPSGARTLNVEGPVQVLGAALATEEKKQDNEPSYRRGLLRGDAFWAADSDGALVELRPGVEPKPLATFPSSVGALHEANDGVLVGVGAQLLLLDASGRTMASAWCSEDDQGPLTSRGSLIAYANRDLLGFYRRDGAALKRLGGLAVPGGKHLGALGFVSDDRLLASASGQLLLVDVSQPSAPRVVRRWEQELRVLATDADSAVLVHEGFAYVAAVRHDELTISWRVKVESSPFTTKIGTGGLAIVTRGAATVLAGDRAHELTLLGADGYPLEARVLRLDENGGLALTDAGLVRLERLAHDDHAIRSAVQAQVPRCREWLVEHVEAWLKDGLPASEEFAARPLGGVVLQWASDRSLGLRGVGPCSVVSAGYEQFEQLALSAAEERPQPASRAEKQQASALQHARSRVGQAERARASFALAGELLERFAATSKARFFFAGAEAQAGLAIVGARAGGGDAAPRRAQIAPRAAKSLREQFTGSRWYASVPAWAARAKKDATFRAEVLALLEQENLKAANRIVLELFDVDPAGCKRAFLAAAGRDLDFAFDGLATLCRRGDTDAREKLLSVIDDGDEPSLALAARLELGLVDEDATLPLVAKVLEAGEEVPSRTLAALSEARVASLKDALVAAREEQEDDALLVPLVRAGWTPDEKTIAKGNREREQEDDFMSGLFGGDDHQDAKAHAVRTWTAQRIATAIATDGPLWPAEVPIEKKRISWQRFFDAAWPMWDRRGLLDRLFEVLPARAAASRPREGEKNGADAQLAFQVLYQALLRGDPRATALGKALEAVPYDEKARADLVRLARLARLQFGWSLVKAQRLAEARKVADAAVADGPNDGQVLFFEARLAWLERNDPHAAIERIGPALARAEDAVGRARLLNLHGAAFDALGRPADALPMFQKALAVNESAINPDTGKAGDATMSASILSNIAEAHWKLGQREDARRFAEQAARRGSTTEIVKEILAATEG